MKTGYSPGVEINLVSLCENAELLKKTVGDFYCVLKCDAYGHGDRQCAEALSLAGFDRFAVFSVSEAERIRKYSKEILILGRSEPEIAEFEAERGYIQTVSSLEYLEILGNRSVIPRVHLKLDCGMNRSGFRCSPDLIAGKLGKVRDRVCGIYTHFHSADCPDIGETEAELSEFRTKSDAVEVLVGRKLLRHAAASAAALRLPDSRFDLSRMGIALYGCVPDCCPSVGLIPVMKFYGRVTELRYVRKGENIGYGTGNRAARDMLVATAAAGYSSGLRRELYRGGKPRLNGYPVSFAGKICMDRCMLDVTDAAENGIFPKTGDIVEFFGERTPVSEAAKAAGTISYELLTNVGGCCKNKIWKK